MAELKLNLGSGDQRFEGFINIDLYDDSADIKADICQLPYADNSVDEILCLQTIEHIAYNRTEEMFKEMYRVLKPGGKAHIECPDMMSAAKSIYETGDIDDKWIKHIWGEYFRPWDKDRYEEAENHEGSKHRTGFTYQRLCRICLPLGFKVEQDNYKFMDVDETLSVDLIKRSE